MKKRIYSFALILAILVTVMSGMNTVYAYSKSEMDKKIQKTESEIADLKKKLSQAKAKEKVLNKEEKKEEVDYEKLSAALAVAKAKDKKAKAAKIKAEKKANEHPAQQNNAASKSHSSIQTNTSRSHHTTGAAAGNHGDMNTAQTGKIVGNHNSKIYHVPGQAGYRMNSANAVYFNTEVEAKAAGYRKSLR